MVVSCKKASWVNKHPTSASVSAIVPVNNEVQYALNVAKSPGLAEIAAEMIPCRQSPTAANAFEAGRTQSHGEWLLFCHQDMYFPRNFGFTLDDILLKMPKECSLVGFVGLGGNRVEHPYKDTFKSGLMVDRMSLLDWPDTDFAVSFDECAILLRKDSDLKIDPELGWHLWATDLCIQTINQCHGRIVRAPVYHNSLADYSLSLDYAASAKKLASKYPSVNSIKSLCGLV
jgi:hypothetical protein